MRDNEVDLPHAGVLVILADNCFASLVEHFALH